MDPALNSVPVFGEHVDTQTDYEIFYPYGHWDMSLLFSYQDLLSISKIQLGRRTEHWLKCMESALTSWFTERYTTCSPCHNMHCETLHLITLFSVIVCYFQAGKFNIIPTIINIGSGLALMGAVSINFAFSPGKQRFCTSSPIAFLQNLWMFNHVLLVLKLILNKYLSGTWVIPCPRHANQVVTFEVCLVFCFPVRLERIFSPPKKKKKWIPLINNTYFSGCLLLWPDTSVPDQTEHVLQREEVWIDKVCFYGVVCIPSHIEGYILYFTFLILHRLMIFMFHIFIFIDMFSVIFHCERSHWC